MGEALNILAGSGTVSVGIETRGIVRLRGFCSLEIIGINTDANLGHGVSKPRFLNIACTSGHTL